MFYITLLNIKQRKLCSGGLYSYIILEDIKEAIFYHQGKA